MFNIRERIEDGESFRGYIGRVVETNGYPSVATVCRNIDRGFSLETSHISTNSHRSMVSNLETALRLGRGELLASVHRHYPWWAVLGEGDQRRVYTRSARVCPLCVGQTSVLPAEWDNALEVVCRQHQIRLIDQCPHCEVKISFARGRLNICSRCEFDLSKASKELETHDLLLHVAQNLATKGGSYLALLISACDRMHRPLDLHLATPRLNQMSICATRNLLIRAGSLLHCAKFRQSYKDYTRNASTRYGALEQQVGTLPYTQFIAIAGESIDDCCQTDLAGIDLCHEPTTLRGPVINPLTLAETLGLDTARLSGWCNDIEYNLASQISAEQLALLLGIRLADIRDLVEGGRLKPINTGKYTMHLWFDLTRVDRLLSGLTMTNSPENIDYQPLADLVKVDMLKLFNADLSTVWDIIFSGAVPIYRTNSASFFRSCQVSSSAFLAALHTRLISQENELTGRELANVIHTSAENAKRFVFEFLKQNRDTKPIHLMSRWISLNRLCRFLPYRTDKLHHLLSEAAYQPAYERADGKTRFRVYEYSDTLYTLLCGLSEKDLYIGYIPPAEIVEAFE